MALPNPDWENTHYYCCTEIWMLSSLLLKEVWYLPSIWMFGVKHNDSGKHNTRKITNCKKKSHKSTWVFQTKVRTMTDNIHLHSMRLYIYILLQICSLHFPWCFIVNCSLPFRRMAERHWLPSTTKRTTNWPTNFWHIGQTIPLPPHKKTSYLPIQDMIV